MQHQDLNSTPDNGLGPSRELRLRHRTYLQITSIDSILTIIGWKTSNTLICVGTSANGVTVRIEIFGRNTCLRVSKILSGTLNDNLTLVLNNPHVNLSNRSFQ
jgi:hypothetical protein